MPRILTIIRSLPREHIKTYILIRFREREFCDGVWNIWRELGNDLSLSIHTLSVHTQWRSYESPAIIPSAIINTQIFYPASKVVTSTSSNSETNLMTMFIGRWWWTSGLKGTRCTMFRSNYDRTIGPKLPITASASTAGGGTVHMK